MPPKENSPYRLLVEGVDDQWSVINLMRRHGIDWDDKTVILPYVHSTGGVAPLLKSIEIAAKTYERLGIVLDADLSSVDRYKQVKGRLEAVGIAAPDELDENGVVFPGLRPVSRIGIWMMPDNKSPGSIEHFLTKLIPQDDPCWPHAQSSTEEAKSLGAAFIATESQKAMIHTWLAWNSPPGMPFGTALTAEVLGADSMEALRFVEWFMSLYTT